MKMIGRNYNVKQEVPKDENMASRVVLQRDFSKLEIDKGIENCWKWEWLEQSVDGNLLASLLGKLIPEELPDVSCARI
jgi:hypothetical protein